VHDVFGWQLSSALTGYGLQFEQPTSPASQAYNVWVSGWYENTEMEISGTNSYGFFDHVTAYVSPYANLYENRGISARVTDNIAYNNVSSITAARLGSTGILAAMDYNDFWDPVGAGVMYVSPSSYYTTVTGVGSWSAASGFDAHSLKVDPMIVNGPAFNTSSVPTPCSWAPLYPIQPLLTCLAGMATPQNPAVWQAGDSGRVVDFTYSNLGAGYSGTCAAVITPQDTGDYGSGATATCSFSGGAVVMPLVITNPGSRYRAATPAQVTFTCNGGACSPTTPASIGVKVQLQSLGAIDVSLTYPARIAAVAAVGAM
jgi:hypothetical protein